MKLSVGLKVSNSLSLTPQLQQAIRLLQLSSLELQEEITLQLESNPFLEKQETENFEEIEKNDINEEDIPNDLEIDVAWEDIYIHQSCGSEKEESDDYENSYQIGLEEYLYQQINLLHFSKIDKLIAHIIIDELDEDGFLKTEISDITASVNKLLLQMDSTSEIIEEEEILVVLKYIQQLEPLGVASRSLVEFLKIQLFDVNDDAKVFACKILQYDQLLLKNDINKLVKLAKISDCEFKAGLDLIRGLRSSPKSGFVIHEVGYQIPDVVVAKKNSKWSVTLNPEIIPKLRINSFYSNLIKRADQSKDNQYLKSHFLDAKNFIKGVDERHKTLLKVTSCIVKHQKDFLEKGAEAMKPLILKDISEEVELHESTISRVTTNKYVLTPQGLFELKYFFSSHVGTSVGGECSSTAIRAKIKKMISSEDPKKPLSDNKLSNLLKEDGIVVARRTVAKYRESLNIPSSSERKILI